MFILNLISNFFQESGKPKSMDPLIKEINESLDGLTKQCLLNRYDRDDLKKAIATINTSCPGDAHRALKILENTTETIKVKRDNAEAYKTPNTKEEVFKNYTEACDRFLAAVAKLNEDRSVQRSLMPTNKP